MLALAPQVEPASFIISKLFRFFSLPAVFVKRTVYEIGWVALMPKAQAIEIN